MSPVVPLPPWHWLHRDGVLVPSVLLLLSLLLLAVLRRRRGAYTGGLRLPPSPPKLPIIGNLHQVGSRHRSLAALARTQGPLMLLQLGQVPALVVSSAATAEQIMKTHDAVFANRPELEVIKRLSYGGKDMAFSPYGEYWRNMRKILNLHLLGVRKVQTHKLAIGEEVALMIKKIEQLSSASGVVDLTGVLQDFMVNMIWRIVIGRCFRDEDLKRIFREVLAEHITLISQLHAVDYFPSLRWLVRFTRFNSAVEKAIRKRERLLDGIFESHIMNRSGDDDKRYQEDFVDMLQALQKDPAAMPPLGFDDVKALIIDALSAGTDTTYITLEWAMAELIRNPEVMRKAQAEVRGIAGAKLAVDEADVTQMSYLRAVLKETLRLRPPATLLVPHQSSEDSLIDGYEVAKQTRVIINAWAVMRDPTFWEEPEEFMPERFLGASVDFKGIDFHFIPFGAGRRICPGMQFAVSVIELALANLLHRFDWELPDGLRGEDLDMTETFGMTTRRELRLFLVPKPRAR